MHIHTRRGKLVYPTEDRDARPASQPDVRCTGGVPCQYGCSDLRVGANSKRAGLKKTELPLMARTKAAQLRSYVLSKRAEGAADWDNALSVY
eukprot:scaffold41406_cov18-Tisochrysis_lutea.AAC.1